MRRHVEWLASHLDPNCLQRPSKFGPALKELNSDHYEYLAHHLF